MRTRTHPISIWLDDRELAHLKKMSEQSGLKVDPLIRLLIMGKEIQAKPPDDYRLILRELSAIGNNINQLTRIANSNGGITGEEIGIAVAMVNEIWKVLKGLG